MNAINESKLREIFMSILDLDDACDITSVRKINSERWDSLAQTSLVAAIESEFNVVLGIAEMERITSFAAAALLLEEMGL